MEQESFLFHESRPFWESGDEERAREKYAQAAKHSADPLKEIFSVEELTHELRRYDKRSTKARLEDFLHIWRHPNARLVPPVCIMLMDIWLYATDPIDYSQAEFSVPLVGEVWNLLNLWNGQKLEWYAVLLKPLLACLAIRIGCRIARLVRRPLQHCCWGVMELEKGGFLMPVICCFLCLLAVTQVWNRVLYWRDVERPYEGHDYEQARDVERLYEGTPYFTSGFNVSCSFFSNIIISFVFCLDFMTLGLVVDLILQDGSLYPHWGKVRLPFSGRVVDMRKVWDGRLRLVASWAIFVVAFILIKVFIWYERDLLMRKTKAKRHWTSLVFIHSEFGRAILASLVFLCDVITVCQDWEFPTFENHLRLAVVGTNFVFEGRFLNYAIMVAVMLVDMKSVVMTIVTDPSKYYEFVDPEGFVWVISDMTFISTEPKSTLLAASDFTNRSASGCFQKFDGARYIDRIGWVKDAENFCRDKRTKTQWFGTFHGDDYARQVVIVLSPILLSLALTLLLIYIIPYSRWEFCRRVVLCNAMSYHYAYAPPGSRSLLELARMHVTKNRRDACLMMAQLNQRVWKPTGQSIVVPSSTAALWRAIVEAYYRHNQCHRKILDLYRPPRPSAKLLIVCGNGIHSIHCGINTTVRDLREELSRRKLHGQIQASNVKLRIKPWSSLDEDEFLGHHLPLSVTAPPVCIYVHGKFPIVNAQEGDEVIKRIFRGAVSRILSMVLDACTSLGRSCCRFLRRCVVCLCCGVDVIQRGWCRCCGRLCLFESQRRSDELDIEMQATKSDPEVPCMYHPTDMISQCDGTYKLQVIRSGSWLTAQGPTDEGHAGLLVGRYAFDDRNGELRDPDTGELLGKFHCNPVSRLPLEATSGRENMPCITVVESDAVAEIQNPANAGAYFILPSRLNGTACLRHGGHVESISSYREDSSCSARGQLAVHPAPGQFLLHNSACQHRLDGVSAVDLLLRKLGDAGFTFRLVNGCLVVPGYTNQQTVRKALDIFRSHAHLLRLLVMEEVPASGLAPDGCAFSGAAHRVSLAYASASCVIADAPVGTDTQRKTRRSFRAHLSEVMLAAQYFGALRHAARRRADASERARVFLPLAAHGGADADCPWDVVARSIAIAVEMLSAEERAGLDIRILLGHCERNTNTIFSMHLHEHGKLARAPVLAPALRRADTSDLHVSRASSSDNDLHARAGGVATF